MATEKKFPLVSGLGVPILLVLLIGQLWLYPYEWLNSPVEWLKSPVLVWIVSMVLIVLMLGAIGVAFGKGFWGVLISPANRYSLSQLQMILWTIVLVAAVVAYAAWRKHAGMATMDFDIPTIVWALLGLSTASLVASPLIICKKDEQVAPLPPTQDKPLFRDLVAGEEVANQDTIDLSRVQMLLFTVIAVGAYAAALSAQMGDVYTIKGDLKEKLGDCARFDDLTATYNAMKNTEALKSLTQLCVKNNLLQGFPAFSEGLLAIIAISHAGYLSLKAVNKKLPLEKKAS